MCAKCCCEQDTAFVAGEDVGQAGSVYGYYRGLFDEFGGERIIDTPISEKGIIGLGVGAAATGLRPIVDIMFMDFLGECMDEVANQMAKMRFMFGGNATLPITVLTMAGAGANLAAQHSQSLEAWLAHLPGLKVVMPATPYDVKGLIIAAARDDNPVFVVMNKMSLGLIRAKCRRARTKCRSAPQTSCDRHRLHDRDVGAHAARGAEGRGNAERSRHRRRSDRRAQRAAVRHGNRRRVGEENASRAGRPRSSALRRLRRAKSQRRFRNSHSTISMRPVGRVGAPFSPVPFSPALEKVYVPNAERIVAEARRLIGV